MQKSTVRTALAGAGGLLVPIGIWLAAPGAAAPDEDCSHLGQSCSQSDCSAGNGYPDCDLDSSLVLPVTGGVPAIA